MNVTRDSHIQDIKSVSERQIYIFCHLLVLDFIKSHKTIYVYIKWE